jgi:hypothetical protein
VPFIVVFCRIIETKDKTDLTCLGTFVASIQPAADASEAAAKLHRLFQVLPTSRAAMSRSNPLILSSQASTRK